MGSSQEKHRHEEAIKQIDNKRELERYIEENKGGREKRDFEWPHNANPLRHGSREDR